MPTKTRMPTRIKLGDTKLQKRSGAYLLKTPLMAHCLKCRQYKLAIAAIPLTNSVQAQFKWVCPQCARDLSIQPTQDLLKKLPTMNTLIIRERQAQISQLQNTGWVGDVFEG